LDVNLEGYILKIYKELFQPHIPGHPVLDLYTCMEEAGNAEQGTLRISFKPE